MSNPTPDTPRTNGITFIAQPGMMPPYDTVPAEHGRTLERELNAATAEVERLRERVAKLEEVLIPFISLNPLSRQVQALWDDFVRKARATTKESLTVQRENP